jgi:RNA polymerase sigma factor (sigma-70 family)
MHNPGPEVYVVDDDASVRVALKRLLTLVGLHTEVYGSIEEFMKARRSDIPSCLVLDVRLPGMSGLEFQDQLLKMGMQIPIIFITAQGDSPMTRRAMKAGAIDFLTKPFRKKDLLAAIHQALDFDRSRREEQSKTEELKSRLQKLTPREREVFELVVTGASNKEIAERLGASEPTIKIHRRRVMEKMKAASFVELVKMAERTNQQPSR